MKKLVMTILGIPLFLIFTVYGMLPLIGSIGILVGLIGFFTGSPVALRALLIGLALVSVHPIVGYVILHIGGNRRKE